MLFAIDTATQTISLALHDGQALLAEETWTTASNHTVELAPAVAALLRRQGIAIDGLTALAVSVGPGTYSGLRVGVSLSKALASARGLPLVGITSLDILAAGQPQYTGGLVAVVQAGRSRVIAGTYQWRKSRWQRRGEPQLMDWDTLIASIDGPATLSGEIDVDGRAAIEAAQARGVPVSVAPTANRLRRAGFLAQEAWERLKEDRNGHAAAQVVPLYLKTKDVP